MKQYFLVLLALLALAACHEQQPDTKPSQPEQVKTDKQSKVNLDRHEQGRAIYNFRCYFCHGYSGDAQTLAASYLDPKPRNFQETSLKDLSRERMLASITAGRTDTAMKSFGNTLTREEIELVADFVRVEFMTHKAENTRYHTVENGWPNHERYKPAYPFALGEIPLDTPWEDLTPEQHIGKQFFLTSCISCHDRAKVNNKKAIFELSAISYPRNNHQPGEYPNPSRDDIDAIASASPFQLHDIRPILNNPTEQEKFGESIFQANCAFCHAADGTAKNWIGSFMEPHPRNLVDSPQIRSMTKSKLKATIKNGLPNTSMPAWGSVLKENEIDAVISYISKVFHFIPDSPFEEPPSKTAQPQASWK